jgi:hypothetical protein
MLVSYLAHSSSPKMEARFSSEASVDFHRTMRRYIPENIIHVSQRCENLKSNVTKLCSVDDTMFMDVESANIWEISNYSMS